MKHGRRMLRGLRGSLEWLPLACALRLAPLLSRSRLLWLARRLGDLAYCCDRRGRRVAEANLSVIYGARATLWRRRRLARASYRHAARVVLDVAWFSRDARARTADWTELDPALLAWMRSQCGGIVVTGHLGNWEAAGHAAAAAGFRLTTVAKRIGSARTTRRINRLRRQLGQQIVMSDGAMRGLLRALRAREWVALLLDQATDPYQGGVWVDFLGLPASVSAAAARLSLKLDAPIGVIFAQALPHGRYRCRLLGTCDNGGGGDAAALTQRIAALLTAAIRRHPGQWLLMYKRWKRWPPGHDGAGYPFYASPWSYAEAASVYGAARGATSSASSPSA